MDWPVVFNCCIAAGFLVPVISLIGGGIGGSLDLDIDLDIDAPFPLSVTAFCFAAILFGAAGRLCVNWLPGWASAIIGLGCGAAGFFLLTKLVIAPLRRNRATALRIENMKGQRGVMKLEARRDFVGTVLLLSATGSQVGYDALPTQNVESIPAGTQVLVVGLEERNGKKVLTVLPIQ